METKATLYHNGEFIFVPMFKINNIQDVKRFFGWLVFADLVIHPDDRFVDVLNNPKIGEYLDSVLNECFDVCEGTIDIYDLCLKMSYPEFFNK